jgi:hypothetical protein
MKPADLLTLHKLEEIQKSLIVHDARVIERLDKIDTQIKLIGKDETKHVSKELEDIIREVAARAVSIDKKVEDLP